MLTKEDEMLNYLRQLVNLGFISINEEEISSDVFSNAELEELFVTALEYEKSNNDDGSVPEEFIEYSYGEYREGFDYTDVPPEVLEAEEIRCIALNKALAYKAHVKDVLAGYVRNKQGRQAALDTINETKDIWSRLTTRQKREHAAGYKAKIGGLWATFFEERDNTRTAWAMFETARKEQGAAWENYFATVKEFAEALGPYQGALAALRNTEFSRYNCSGDMEQVDKKIIEDEPIWNILRDTHIQEMRQFPEPIDPHPVQQLTRWGKSMDLADWESLLSTLE